jgi:hypothetical protein
MPSIENRIAAKQNRQQGQNKPINSGNDIAAIMFSILSITSFNCLISEETADNAGRAIRIGNGCDISRDHHGRQQKQCCTIPTIPCQVTSQ